MEQKQWKYKIGSGKMPVILTLLMFAIFGGLTVWLHSTNNGAFIFTGLFSAIMLILVIATSYRLAFFKVLIGKDGFYYQTGPGNGKYYDYTAVEKAWISSGTAQNGAQQEYCNIEISGSPVIRFQFFYADSKGVDYLINRVEASVGKEIAERREEKAEYLIDGKVFGKTRIVIGVVLLIIVAVIEAVVIQVSGSTLLVVPGIIMALIVLGYLIVNNLFFKIQIGENGFYYRTNPFNGQRYEYCEITHCKKIKKVVRIRRPREAETPKYYFFFEFTDVRGVTQKFQYEEPIHGYEVDVLKERIEKAKNRG